MIGIASYVYGNIPFVMGDSTEDVICMNVPSKRIITSLYEYPK